MKTEATAERNLKPQRLRYELQQEETSDLRRRRAVIGLSLVGMASMTAVTLLQTGIIKHLPDPPLRNFDSDRVNSSDTAYRFGLPDGSISLASLAVNIPIAAFGGAHRARRQPSPRSSPASRRASKQSLPAGISIKCRPRKKPGAGTVCWARSPTSALPQ